MLVQELQAPFGRERCVKLRRLHPQNSLLKNADSLSQEIMEIDHVAITRQEDAPAALQKIRYQKLPLLNERAPASGLGTKKIEAIPNLARVGEEKERFTGKPVQ